MNTSQDLLNRYSLDTPLAEIPWQELPICLQKTCEQFLKCWWDDIDIDQTIEASGLSDMTLAELLAYRERQGQSLSGPAKRYRVVAYMRTDSEDEELLTYKEALSEKEQQELMFPENLYQIEEVKSDEDHRESPGELAAHPQVL